MGTFAFLCYNGSHPRALFPEKEFCDFRGLVLLYFLFFQQPGSVFGLVFDMGTLQVRVENSYGRQEELDCGHLLNGHFILWSRTGKTTIT